MGFLGIYRALYDYTPNEAGELAIKQGDLLYVLEKNDDDGWWRAKKKAGTDDEDEPTGLIPNNYVEKAETVGHARAIYEYTRQTDEELSFPEDAVLEVFDTTDEDWILAGLDGEYGFVPANYIEVQAATPASAPAPPAAPVLPRRPTSQSIPAPVDNTTPSSDDVPAANPAAALASVIQNRQSTREPLTLRFKEPELSDEESVRSPALPSRPRPQSQAYSSASIEPPAQPERAAESQPEGHLIPGGFHMYNINEMVSVMGKKKKMPTTLGINLLTGTILIAPERAQDDPPQEWTADKMTHYSREGKHVFMELVRPSKSIDFHAGAKDTAEEIVAALGELAGAARAEGLREVIMAGSQKRQRKGTVLYDFMAQGEDEVTVAAGDEVAIIDDSRSEDWWQVRRLKNGKEGVVPSSYIEFSGTITPPLVQSATAGGQSSARSTVEQNRLDELRLTKEAIKASKEPQQVGQGMRLPRRGSSLLAPDDGNNLGQQRNRRENGRSDGGGSSSAAKSKPDPSKVRTWTDRSKSFSVEAQFLGLKDGKLHLHKMNGVKIAVPIAKMSREDLEYVENLTGISLDDERPLADVKRSKPPEQQKAPAVGASVDKSQGRPEYDWFQFFLSCDVAVGLCERYAQAFTRDSMDESVLPDVDASVLRNLGLREGDIIKVMRTLDAKFGRDRSSKVNGDGDGGLFSGPGGALRNNTRKGRPAPAVQTGDVVDAAVFSTKDTTGSTENATKPVSPVSPAKSPKRPAAGGFDDDAWDVKPTKQEQQTQRQEPQPPVQAPAPVETPAAPAPAPVPAPAPLSGNLKELSLLTAPLEPSKTEPQVQPLAQLQAANTNSLAQDLASPPAPQPLLGASPSFFSTVPQPNQVISAQPSQASLTGVHISPKSLARQRPAPPSISPPVQGSLVVPPPPQRPLSAPQSSLPQGLFSAPALVPQVTGLVQGQVAPYGQSLNDLTHARLQQQYTAQIQNLQPVPTGYIGPQQTGLPQYAQGAPGPYLQPLVTGAPGYVDPSRINQFGGLQPQPTGFQPQPTGFQPQPTGFQPGLTQSPFGSGSINNYLPPALQPQPTGFQSLQPLQPTPANELKAPVQPLLPQKTGPPPPVRFGVTPETKKLTPQPTGRRANLAQATPENPFGF